MGTNYYTKKRCDCCGHIADEHELHIGKSSGGWKFHFAPYPERGLISWRAWRLYLASGVPIFDEYGEPCSFEKFVMLVEAKQEALNNELGAGVVDREGYGFSTTDDFS